ncbi:hypothetical protein EZS27_013179 [termite gut metagenome]|uniref:Uncharacterized protein n=1 Tax=termite gut metagenome TaxID=433724 RepID=A0A5J4RZ73_9ZZZZ
MLFQMQENIGIVILAFNALQKWYVIYLKLAMPIKHIHICFYAIDYRLNILNINELYKSLKNFFNKFSTTNSYRLALGHYPDNHKMLPKKVRKYALLPIIFYTFAYTRKEKT